MMKIGTPVGNSDAECMCHCFECPPLALPVPITFAGADAGDAAGILIIDERDGEQSLTTETVTFGSVAATVSVAADSRTAPGADSGGSRRVTIAATSASADPWVAGTILWDDSGATYDPSVQGSIKNMRARGAWRLHNKRSPLTLDENARPRVRVAIVIEQAGVKYFSWWIGSSGNQFLKGCWSPFTGTVADTADFGFGLSDFFRSPYYSEGRRQAGMPDPYLGRCESFFSVIDTDGVWDTDQRPDLSFDVVSRPITKFGIAFLLSGHDPDMQDTDPGTSEGEYLLDVVVDHLWLSIETHGVPKMNDEIGAVVNAGTLLIDEPLTAIPSGWDDGYPLEILQDWDAPIGQQQLLSCSGIRPTVLVDGLVGQDGIDTLFAAEKYHAMRLSPPMISLPSLTFPEDFRLQIDFTWHTIDEADHIDGSQPYHEREVDAGIWIDSFIRLTLRRESWHQDHDCGPAGVHLKLHCQRDTASNRHTQPLPSYAGNSNIECNYTGATGAASSGSGNPDCGASSWSGVQRPLSGDRVRVVIRRSVSDADVLINQAVVQGILENFDCVAIQRVWREWMMSYGIWINGRLVTNAVLPLAAGSGLLGRHWTVASDQQMRLGLVGLCGGRLSDFRVWMR
tara:strand:- start:295089 stop:296960 length:1872 start_codon:yes stop_codon:yes gene_type:complete